MRGHHHCGAACERVANTRHRSANPRIVGDVAGIVLRDVEIGTDEHALAANVGIDETADCHMGQM